MPGDLVFDPFCGSGLTGVAALETGRRALLSDFSPAAVHIAQNYTKPCKIADLRAAYKHLHYALAVHTLRILEYLDFRLEITGAVNKLHSRSHMQPFGVAYPDFAFGIFLLAHGQVRAFQKVSSMAGKGTALSRKHILQPQKPSSITFVYPYSCSLSNPACFGSLLPLVLFIPHRPCRHTKPGPSSPLCC